jgi:hypothetical protein
MSIFAMGQAKVLWSECPKPNEIDTSAERSELNVDFRVIAVNKCSNPPQLILGCAV